MLVETRIIGIFVPSCSIILHSSGIYLLSAAYRGDRRRTQVILMINLAISELLLSLGVLSRNAVMLFSKGNALSVKVANFIFMMEITTFSLVFYATMALIPLHRCFTILIGLRSMNSWSSSKTRIICYITWGCSILAGAIFITLKYFLKFEQKAVLFAYSHSLMDCAMVIIFVVTYGLIYKKFKRSERFFTNTMHRRATNSKFYIQTLLIVTFIIFIVLPDIIIFFYVMILKRESPILFAAVSISYTLSVMVDATIYIFLQKPVRKILVGKICRSMESVESHIDNTSAATIRMRKITVCSSA